MLFIGEDWEGEKKGRVERRKENEVLEEGEEEWDEGCKDNLLINR